MVDVSLVSRLGLWLESSYLKVVVAVGKDFSFPCFGPLVNSDLGKLIYPRTRGPEDPQRAESVMRTEPVVKTEIHT